MIGQPFGAEAKPAVTDVSFCTRPLNGSTQFSSALGGKTSEISSDSVYAVKQPLKRSRRSVAVATIAAWIRVSYGRAKPLVYVWKQWPSRRITTGRVTSTTEAHVSSSYRFISSPSVSSGRGRFASDMAHRVGADGSRTAASTPGPLPGPSSRRHSAPPPR